MSGTQEPKQSESVPNVKVPTGINQENDETIDHWENYQQTRQFRRVIHDYE